MIFLRSIAFNILFYVNFLIQAIVGLPALYSQNATISLAKFWARSCIFLLRTVAGIRVEVRGAEHIPAGPLLVASKHQSALETIALIPLFDSPAFILKRELMWLPIFGWYTRRARLIPVNRGARAQALKDMTVHARQAMAENRQIIIFPEGTRRPVGAEPRYKYGVAHLYASLNVPCLPVALNSGMFWPRRTFLKHPGTVVIEILPPIMPGMEKEVFQQELLTRIETATDQLVEEACMATEASSPMLA